MRIDLSRECPIPIQDVPKLAWVTGRRGKHVNLATIYRWCTRGIRGVRLEYLQCGGTRVTTAAALLRFFAALTHRNSTGGKSDRSEEQQAQVEKELRSLGID
jgi:hypothetical protein